MMDPCEKLDSCEEITSKSGTQEQILRQFRKNVSDILTPDVTDKVILKWLRTNNFNLKKSEELYRTSIMTKAVFNMDEIESTWEVPEVIQKYEFANSLGYAKDGTPIHFVAMGRGDLKGFIMSLDMYNLGRYCSSIIERDLKRCKKQSIKLGKEINEVTYIIDMDCFAIGQVLFSGVVELGLDLLRIYQDHYPEIWKHLFIVNVPFYFQTVFNLFKPIFKNTFLQKIHVATRDRTASLLLNYVDAEELPEFLGGKLVDSSGDPMCSEFMKFGGIIPENYYLRNRSLLMPTDFGVVDIWLPHKTCYNFNVVVRQANSIIRVELRTEGGSIPAVLLYRKFGPDPENPDLPGINEYLDPSDKKYNVEQFSPFLHMQTHVCPIDNYCFAPIPGIYIFRLDNTYNWLAQRRCIFRIRLLPPDA